MPPELVTPAVLATPPVKVRPPELVTPAVLATPPVKVMPPELVTPAVLATPPVKVRPPELVTPDVLVTPPAFVTPPVFVKLPPAPAADEPPGLPPACPPAPVVAPAVPSEVPPASRAGQTWPAGKHCLVVSQQAYPSAQGQGLPVMGTRLTQAPAAKARLSEVKIRPRVAFMGCLRAVATNQTTGLDKRKSSKESCQPRNALTS
jgi:hypothetical protein